jgi:hypothetical protein
LALFARVLREVSAAVVVLALVLFSLSSTIPASLASTQASVSTAYSDCGTGDPTKHVTGITCHACRATPVVLPTPPYVVQTVEFAQEIVASELGDTQVQTRSAWVIPASRAPPLLG